MKRKYAFKKKEIPMSDPKIRKGLYINNKMVNEKDLKKYFPNLQTIKNKK